MKLVAVIPCLNEAAHLSVLIEQMLTDSAIDRIIVADGGSTDGSQAIVASFCDTPRVVLMDNPDRIQSAGINRAVQLYAEGYDWLLRLDAHCQYPNDYGAKLVLAAQKHGASAVVVPMITCGTSGFQRAAAAAQNSILGTGGSAHRHLGNGRFVDHGHHALMDLAMFRQVGGYCEAMPCNEDAEFDHRQLRAGGSIWLEPSAAITYFPRKTVAALWKQYRKYGQGRARNLRRHAMVPRLRQLVPLGVLVALAILPLSVFHAVVALPAFAWLALCLTAGAFIGVRAGGGWAIAAGLAAATMQLAWAAGFAIEWLRNPVDAAPRYRLLKATDSAS